MRRMELDTIICPVRVKVDGLVVNILEVLKHELHDGTTFYTVVCQVSDGKIVTRPFCVDCMDIEDFKRKLKLEITKYKMFKFVLTEKELRSLVGGT